MLVKIIAMGSTPQVWKELFDQLRAPLQEVAYSVAIFSRPEELEYLEREILPHRWKQECPDFLIAGMPAPERMAGELALFQAARTRSPKRPPALVLAMPSLEKGLKELVGRSGPVTLLLEDDQAVSLSDPTLLVRKFPREFPRIPVGGSLSGLRLRSGDGSRKEVRPDKLDIGAAIGFSQIETCFQNGEAKKPREWLKGILREVGRKRLPRVAGLLREPGGMFLFPGVPFDRVRGVAINGVSFSLLLETGKAAEDSPSFQRLVAAIRKTGERHEKLWRTALHRIRTAENRTDIPVVCGGGNALLRATLGELMVADGYQRCFTLATPGEGLFREPTLLLQVAPWQRGELGAQAEAPLVLQIGEDLEGRLKGLDSLLPWRDLPLEKGEPDPEPLSGEAFTRQKKRLIRRGSRAESELSLTEKRTLLLTQETEVLRTAQGKLLELLGARDTIQIWNGKLPRDVRQVLVFSHDQEEAGAVLQALPKIAKKRWFDLSPYTDADSLPNLNLADVRHYADAGMMVMTASSRERLQALYDRTEAQLAEGEQGLSDSSAALTRLREEHREVAEAKRKLARRWVRETLAQWLADNQRRIGKGLELLRERHERRWFGRAQVRRVTVFPSRQENREALLEACREVYPGFALSQSIVVPYEFEFLTALPEEEAEATRARARRDGLVASAAEARVAEALARRNEALFADYLQVVGGDLADVRTDLLLIEHQPEIALRLLGHLRMSRPKLKHTPALLIFPDHWVPPERKGLPWPRTRVLLLRRMGALNAADCARHLRAMYAV